MSSKQTESVSIDHLFRHHSGQMISVLVRIFGIRLIDDIEDAVQDALVKALKKWPIYGVPEKPLPWLIQVAKNALYDKVRRDGRSTELDERDDVRANPEEVKFENELDEDQLRMIFACCHPSISPDSQIAITLKTVGGFHNREIASAFLSKKTAIDKLVSRAKGQLKKNKSSMAIPAPDRLPSRLNAVLKVLYLMFNEGYMASGGPEVLRRDLCVEAIRLAELLSVHPATKDPKVDALLALFYFQASRFGSRTDEMGLPVLLPEQDRASWDKALIKKGLERMKASAAGEELSTYHLEAEIASHHALAKTYEDTDWEAICACYELLQKVTESPVVALNRLYALSRTGRSKEAYEELVDGENTVYVKMYQYFLVKAELAKDLGLTEIALSAYAEARKMAENESIKKFVAERMKTVA